MKLNYYKFIYIAVKTIIKLYYVKLANGYLIDYIL